MKLASGAHLTYCTNIHAGETWPEVRAALEKDVVAVKARVAKDVPFGVGLRLSAQAAVTLEQPRAREELKAILRDRGLYVFTINGFPYGAFHGTRIKENVYEPDWRSDERIAYTNRLASLLADLLPVGVDGSVSTLPGAFAPKVHGAADRDRIADGIVRHAEHLAGLREATGKTVRLGLEPEPWCMLETAGDAVGFLEGHVFSRRPQEAMLREHVGMCLDTCHAAVAFEDPRAMIATLQAAGVRVVKIQVTAALESPAGSDRAALSAFADDVYLHQVVARDAGGGLERYLDLPDALRAGAEGTWRVHFHVPVFRESFGVLASTQAHLREVLRYAKDASDHLEVETYTWDVLPVEEREVPMVDAIAREIDWVRGTLA